MPKLSALVSGDMEDTGGTTKLSDLLAQDTAQLKSQFQQPQGSIPDAAKKDAGGFLNWLASMDFTNPSNIPNVIKSGVPMALQVGATAAFPESILGRILASGGAGIAGRGVQQGVNAMQGQPVDMSPGGFAKDAAINAIFQGGAEMASPLASTISGKGAAEAAGAAASKDAAENIAQAETLGQLKQANKRAEIALNVEDAAKDLEAKRTAKIADIQKGTEEQYQADVVAQQQKTADLTAKAEQDHANMLQDLTNKKASAEQAVQREVAKHSETALQGLTDEQVEKSVRDGLGPRATMPEVVNLDDLTSAVIPVQKASQNSVQSVFNGVSAKFQDVLKDYGDIPIPQPTIRPAIRTLQRDLREHGDSVSPSMAQLMKKISGGDVPAANVRGANEAQAQKIVDGLRRAGNEKAANDLAAQFNLAAPNRDTVQKMMGFRAQLTDKIIKSSNATDRRAAATIIDSIDQDIQKVVPEEAQTALGVLRDQWHTARSTFSGAFRSRLFRASSPDQVAEAIYTGAKTGKQMGHRAELLVNQMKAESPEQVPLLSQAFTSMLTNSKDVVGDIQKMPPGLFKSLYPGTGFDKPEGWVQAIRGQQTAEKILADPEMMARFNSAVQTGMASLGSKAKKDALAAAERALANAPEAQTMIQESLKSAPPSPDLSAMLSKSMQKAPPAPDRGAMLDKALKREPTPEEAGKHAVLGMESPAQAGEAAGMEAMRKPFLGRFQAYMAHRMEFDIGLALLGGSGFLTHHPGAAAAGLTYLAGSRAISAALANPKIGRMYYNFITSKTVEQMGLWAGRMAAAGLSESVKENTD